MQLHEPRRIRAAGVRCGDIVRTPTGRLAKLVAETGEGKVECQYLDDKGYVVLKPELLVYVEQ